MPFKTWPAGVAIILEDDVDDDNFSAYFEEVTSTLKEDPFLIRTLKIVHSKLSEKNVVELMKILDSSDSFHQPLLVSLDLSYNVLTEKSLEAIGHFISLPSCPLRYLRLVRTFGSVNVKKFTQGFQKNQSLICLDLSDNNLSEGWIHVAECLLTNTTLQRLHLRRTRIQLIPTLLCDALKKPNSLTTVDLGDNLIADRTYPDIKRIVDVLKASPLITDFNVRAMMRNLKKDEAIERTLEFNRQHWKSVASQESLCLEDVFWLNKCEPSLLKAIDIIDNNNDSYDDNLTQLNVKFDLNDASSRLLCSFVKYICSDWLTRGSMCRTTNNFSSSNSVLPVTLYEKIAGRLSLKTFELSLYYPYANHIKYFQKTRKIYIGKIENIINEGHVEEERKEEEMSFLQKMKKYLKK